MLHNSKFTHSLNVMSRLVFFLLEMFDCVAEVNAERHSQEGMRARAKLGQRTRETVCLLEKPPPDPRKACTAAQRASHTGLC